MKNRIIIIGSGMGGISSALRAKKKGFEVIIIERNKNLGGKAQFYKDNKLMFDAGPTIVTAPYLFEELFNLFGKKLNKFVHFLEVKNLYKFSFIDKTSFNYYNNLNKTKNNIKLFSQSDFENYMLLLLISQTFFDICFKIFSNKPFYKILQLIKFFPMFITLKGYTSYFSLINLFIKNYKLKQIFSIYPLLLGGNPGIISCLYSLILYLEQIWGIHYPKGGIGNLVQKIESLMREEGIKIYTGVSVTKLITHNKQALAVLLNNNHYLYSRYLISNIEPTHLYKNIITNKFCIKNYISKLEYSIGLFILYFGVNCFYSNISHHTIFFNNYYTESIKNIFYTTYFNQNHICIYLHNPTKTDHFCNHSTFYALIPIPNLNFYNNWSFYENERFVQNLLTILDSHLLPKLKKNIITCFYITPKFFKERYLSTFGSAFSISPNSNQIAWFRFHNKSKSIKNLYLVGAGTHPGAGLPGVLLSAKILDQLII